MPLGVGLCPWRGLRSAPGEGECPGMGYFWPPRQPAGSVEGILPGACKEVALGGRMRSCPVYVVFHGQEKERLGGPEEAYRLCWARLYCRGGHIYAQAECLVGMLAVPPPMEDWEASTTGGVVPGGKGGRLRFGGR